MRFINNPNKFPLALFAFAVFSFLSYRALTGGQFVLFIIYLVLSIIYLLYFLQYSVILEVDEDGVRNRFLCWTYNDLKWDQIKEIGIANMKVIRNENKDKLGELYIYISPVAMDDDERLYMCLHWPPKEQLYMRYSPKRLADLHNFWYGDPAYAWMTETAFKDKYYK